MRNRPLTDAVLRLPLLRASRTLGQLPLVFEEVLEKVVAPLRWRRRPRDLETAGDGVGAFAGLVAALPAETLLLEVAALRFAANVGHGRPGAMRRAERVSSGNQRHRLLVVHRHAAERLADVPCGPHGIGIPVRSFRVHVDEAHLHGAERVRQLPIAAVALVAKPRRLGAPVDLLGLPAILTPTGKTERLESHRLEGDVAGRYHQIGPRDLSAVLLLSRPAQPASTTEVAIIR